MKLLEFIDRRDARRFAQGQKKRDYTPAIGAMFLIGYFILVWRFTSGDVPGGNTDLIQDAMLVLGPAVGLVIGALFRRDGTDQVATENTGRAFEAIKAAQSGTAGKRHREDCECIEDQQTDWHEGE